MRWPSDSQEPFGLRLPYSKLASCRCNTLLYPKKEAQTNHKSTLHFSDAEVLMFMYNKDSKWSLQDMSAGANATSTWNNFCFESAPLLFWAFHGCHVRAPQLLSARYKGIIISEQVFSTVQLPESKSKLYLIIHEFWSRSPGNRYHQPVIHGVCKAYWP